MQLHNLQRTHRPDRHGLLDQLHPSAGSRSIQKSGCAILGALDCRSVEWRVVQEWSSAAEIEIRD